MRRCKNWIEKFVELTEPSLVAEIWRKWAGISCLVGGMERRVWTWSRNSKLYPNLYVVLCGPPGVGKTLVIDDVRFIWRESGLKTSASSVSRASLYDELAAAERKVVLPHNDPPVISYNALQTAINELQVFMPAHDLEFMGALQDLYDCKDDFRERKRTNDINIEVKHPYFNFLAGTTPSFVNNLMPPGAWEQGFASRTFFIYNSLGTQGDVFADTTEEDKMHTYKDLIEDMKQIGELYGRMVWTEEAKDAYRGWAKGGFQPVPEHPRLVGYNSRRGAHLIKLAMACSVNEGLSMHVTVSHYRQALDLMCEAEAAMANIFKTGGGGTDKETMMMAWQFVWESYIASGNNPVPESKLIVFLAHKIEPHRIDTFIKIMIRAGIFSNQVTAKGALLTPRPWKTRDEL